MSDRARGTLSTEEGRSENEPMHGLRRSGGLFAMCDFLDPRILDEKLKRESSAYATTAGAPATCYAFAYGALLHAYGKLFAAFSKGVHESGSGGRCDDAGRDRHDCVPELLAAIVANIRFIELKWREGELTCSQFVGARNTSSGLQGALAILEQSRRTLESGL